MSLTGDAATPARELQADYQTRLSQEEKFFEKKEEVHSLPPIFHYWSNRYIRPKLEAVGYKDPTDLFRASLARQCERRANGEARFLSIGAGNCDMEIDLALKLRESSHNRFVIDCLDLNETMLERGRLAAASQGVAGHLNPLQADFNQWRPIFEYDGVIANHALHHVVNLEGLFTGIKESLKPGGCFAIADMIGRNGHQRWPEALSIIHEFWRRLPPSYRFNHQLKRYEEMFEDWDCSTQGFEGVRAQDILPLLVENFHFESFVAFGNLTDPFVERSFGPNFDATAKWDLAFIDEIHQRNEDEIARGRIKPTLMFAVATVQANGPTVYQEPFGPAFCVRQPDSPPISAKETPAAEKTDPYDPEAWTRDTQQELEIACRRLQDLSIESETLKVQSIQQTLWAMQVEKEFKERTEWALALEKELQARKAWGVDMEKELEAQTNWARDLDSQLTQAKAQLADRSPLRRVLARLKR